MRLATNKTFIAAMILLGVTRGALSACAPETVSVRGDWGNVQFSVEIADDTSERAQGLMRRESLARSKGMLFIYDEPGNLTFWMRNTLIPLDMIFIRPDGEIAHIHENAVPLDETPIPGGPGNLAVLEINGGLARSLGISVGDSVRHEAFSSQSPVWPCEN
ncbi:MAG: DUF192 domain-containing protein [Litoreibacter sp.]